MTMAISDQERQKVVQYLHDMILRPWKMETRLRVECPLLFMGVDVDDDGFVTYYDVERLIELVDRPTCRNVADPCDGSIFECSKCGEIWELDCGNPGDNHLNFCPACGAQVVVDSVD